LLRNNQIFLLSTANLHKDKGKVFESEEEFINELLQNKNVKHYKQLSYLVKNHLSTIVKIRFVLSPFSFVFLLEGEEQYHTILETLDTEEATYIWHIEKNYFHSQLIQVNNDLNIIRNQGRQNSLEIHQPISVIFYMTIPMKRKDLLSGRETWRRDWFMVMPK
jgi:hypothetical protein